MNQNFQKRLVQRVKTFKCSQQNCLSDNQDTLQLAVFGNQQFKRLGFMCTSCFIDNQLIKSLGKVQNHVLPIRKFMNVLSTQYLQYSKIKSEADWTPNLIDQQRKEIKKIATQMQKQLIKGMREIVAYVQQAAQQAVEQIKKNNHDPNFAKINQLLNEEDQSQQQRIDVSKELKTLSAKIQKNQGSYKINNEEEIKQENQKILGRFRSKVQIAQKTLVSLIQTQKKGIKILLQ